MVLPSFAQLVKLAPTANIILSYIPGSLKNVHKPCRYQTPDRLQLVPSDVAQEPVMRMFFHSPHCH